MTETPGEKHYDLEDRTLAFAKESRYWLKLTDTQDEPESENLRNMLIKEVGWIKRSESTIQMLSVDTVQKTAPLSTLHWLKLVPVCFEQGMSKIF